MPESLKCGRALDKNDFSLIEIRYIIVGFGYICSHKAVVLAESEYEVVLYDNFSNSKRSVLDPLETTTRKRVAFIEAEVRNTAKLEGILKTHRIDAAIVREQHPQ